MKALFFIASFCLLLFGSFLKGEQSGSPASRPDEASQLRKQIESLEERVERLEKRLDRMARPRMVPLICIGVSRELP